MHLPDENLRGAFGSDPMASGGTESSGITLGELTRTFEVETAFGNEQMQVGRIWQFDPLTR